MKPEHIKPGLDALLRKLEAKRNAWKREQDLEAWIIERAYEMDDWFLEVFPMEVKGDREHGRVPREKT